MVYAPFDVEKYKRVFDGMYGNGAYDRELENARSIGRTSAQAAFEKESYTKRMKEAEKKAKAQQNKFNQLAELYKQYQSEKDQYSSPTPRLDDYYINMMKKVERPPYRNPYENKDVQRLLPPQAPADNRNLTPWEKIQLLGR